MTRTVRSLKTRRTKVRKRTRQMESARWAGVTGDVLISAMQASPNRNVGIEPTRTRLPVREVCL